jgi:5-hydroxyisourate hydrolase-like protein (transthyretin family)
VEELLVSVNESANVSDVRQIEIHMAEPLVPGPSRLEVEIAIAKLKRHKSNQINKKNTSNSGRTDSSRRRNITVRDPQTH